jgi:hypothetical protein
VKNPPSSSTKKNYSAELDVWLQRILGFSRNDHNLRQTSTSVSIEDLIVSAHQAKMPNR